MTLKFDFTIPKNYRREFFLSLTYAIFIIPLTFLLPFEASFENGFIENFQVIMLISAGISSLHLRGQSTDEKVRAFDLLCALIFFLLAARELSYGGVFFLEWEDAEGRHYVPNSKQPWYPALNAVLAVYILFLVSMLRKIPLRQIFKIPVPIPLISLLIVGIFLSTAGDHEWLFAYHQSQVLEEVSECLMYGISPVICRFYHESLMEFFS